MYCGGFVQGASLPAGDMYRVAAGTRVQTSWPGGDHVLGCDGGSIVFVWARNLSRMV